MINPNKITKKQALKLLQLIEQETRSELMSRLFGDFDCVGYSSYSELQVELRDKVREYAFGTSSLVKLAEHFNMYPKDKKKKKKKKSKKKRRSLL